VIDPVTSRTTKQTRPATTRTTEIQGPTVPQGIALDGSGRYEYRTREVTKPASEPHAAMVVPSTVAPLLGKRSRLKDLPVPSLATCSVPELEAASGYVDASSVPPGSRGGTGVHPGRG